MDNARPLWARLLGAAATKAKEQGHEAIAAMLAGLASAFETDTPEGFNSDRRFMARWTLWGVVVGLACSRPLIAALFSAASVVVLKEGTLLSTKNLKWMVLSALSFAASVWAWSLGRAHDAIDEDRAYLFKAVLRLSARWTRFTWALVLGLFLLSAFLASPKDQAALRAAVEKAGDAAGSAVEKGKQAAEAAVEKGKQAAEAAGERGKQAAGKAAGATAKRLDDFSKKME